MEILSDSRSLSHQLITSCGKCAPTAPIFINCLQDGMIRRVNAAAAGHQMADTMCFRPCGQRVIFSRYPSEEYFTKAGNLSNSLSGLSGFLSLCCPRMERKCLCLPRTLEVNSFTTTRSQSSSSHSWAAYLLLMLP